MMRKTWFSFFLVSTLVSAPVAALGQEGSDYDAGDLGLDDSPPPTTQRKSSSGGGGNVGIGVNATLAPNSAFLGSSGVPGAGNQAVLVQPAVSLRLWFDQLAIEPQFGMLLIAGEGIDAVFGLSAGALFWYAIGTGNLRPMFGGGLLFQLAVNGNAAGNTTGALSFGPAFGIEYRFGEFKNFSFDASLFLPLQINFEPFRFNLATAGGALLGFHYYF